MTDTAIVTQSQDTELAGADWLARAGQAANQAAAATVFAEFKQRRAFQTLRRYSAGLDLFADYLDDAGVPVQQLREFAADLHPDSKLTPQPDAFDGVTFGLVKGFSAWLLKRGYAVSTVNVRLSEVKTVCKLAMQAGVLDSTQYQLIKSVSGFSRNESKNVDQARESAGLDTRTGRKKAEPTRIGDAQVQQMLDQRDLDSGQGRRDALILTLLVNHALRVSELADLTVGDFDLDAQEFMFWRRKTNQRDRHTFNGSARIIHLYFEHDAPEEAGASLLRSSRKDGRLRGAGMSIRAITQRVTDLAERIGVQSLSAHDLRHYAITKVARQSGITVDRLMAFGGWTNAQTAIGYIEALDVQNEGIL